MSKRRTHEQFLKEIYEINPDIIILGQYINNKTPILCKCKKDGYEWYGIPVKMLFNNHGCPKCGGSLKLSDDEFKNQMKEINPNIEIIGKYINSSTKIKCKCKICGNIWENYPYHLKQGQSCKKCSHKNIIKAISKNHEDFINELKIINPFIEVIGTYKNNKTKIKCKCKKCNNIWNPTPDNLLAGKGCPTCKDISKGEKKIKEYLDSNNIFYIFQHKFLDEEVKNLKFDFFIPKLNIVIEYDGQQHFKPVRFGGIDFEKAKKIFDGIKERDKIKDKYCIEKILI